MQVGRPLLASPAPGTDGRSEVKGIKYLKTGSGKFVRRLPGRSEKAG
jgi:hypothetical protein